MTVRFYRQELEEMLAALKIQESAYRANGELNKAFCCEDAVEKLEDVLQSCPNGIDAYPHEEISIVAG